MLKNYTKSEKELCFMLFLVLGAPFFVIGIPYMLYTAFSILI